MSSITRRRKREWGLAVMRNLLRNYVVSHTAHANYIIPCVSLLLIIVGHSCNVRPECIDTCVYIVSPPQL